MAPAADQGEVLERFDFSDRLPGVDRKMYTTIMFTLEKVFQAAFSDPQCEMKGVVGVIQEYLDFFRQVFYQKSERGN